MSEGIKNRYEFVMFYDVENGNPNGDPDAGNMPRLDPETGHGIVTDVCIKRKIRNYVEMTKSGQEGFDIYVRQDITLNAQDKKGVDAVKEEKDKQKKSEGFRAFMCKNFYDIRTFGAVMTTAAKDKELSNVAGQVRGPVQMAFGKSIDPIVPQEITITRVAITTEEKGATASTEMGRKHIVPYALYRQEGFISANLAQKITGFSEDDLNLLWEAILNMFEFDRSAARGLMTLRKLIVFKHGGDHPELGCAAARDLFDLVSVKRKESVRIPRSYGDYEISIGTAPKDVAIIEKR
jgi:CRISPR-associated protein Csd2